MLLVVCLVASWHRGQFDGVSILGVLAAVLWLATLGLFARSTWVGKGAGDVSRLDGLDGRCECPGDHSAECLPDGEARDVA